MRTVSLARVDQRGFSLAELLVAIAIVALIMTGLLTLLKTGNESYLSGANQVEAQGAIRAGLERMTQEIREAGYNPQGLPPCAGGLVPPNCLDAIVNAAATSFTIQNDWDGDGQINNAISVPVQYFWGGVPTNVQRGEQITYSIVGTTLCRMESPAGPPPTAPCPAPAGQSLITNVAQANLGGVQPFFQYLDANGCVIGACGPPTTQADIRTVIVNLMVGAQNQAPVFWQTGAVQVTMNDRIRLRNRTP